MDRSLARSLACFRAVRRHCCASLAENSETATSCSYAKFCSPFPALVELLQMLPQ